MQSFIWRLRCTSSPDASSSNLPLLLWRRWRLHARAFRERFLLSRRKVQALPVVARFSAVSLAFRPQPPCSRVVLVSPGGLLLVVEVNSESPRWYARDLGAVASTPGMMTRQAPNHADGTPAAETGGLGLAPGLADLWCPSWLWGCDAVLRQLYLCVVILLCKCIPALG